MKVGDGGGLLSPTARPLLRAGWFGLDDEFNRLRCGPTAVFVGCILDGDVHVCKMALI